MDRQAARRGGQTWLALRCPQRFAAGAAPGLQGPIGRLCGSVPGPAVRVGRVLDLRLPWLPSPRTSAGDAAAWPRSRVASARVGRPSVRFSQGATRAGAVHAVQPTRDDFRRSAMRRLATLVCFAALAGSVHADFQKGLDAWNGGDYKTAFDEFKQAAEKGDARAQFYLGEAYNKGRGVVQDYAEAMTWYSKAAEQNNAEAQDTLCTMYFFGQGTVKQDYSAAAKFCA